MGWRILHVLGSLRPSAGSIAICVEGLNRALAGHGFQSEIVAEPDRLPATIRTAAAVHIHGWATSVTRAAALAARKAEKPYILSPAGALTPGPYRRSSLGSRIRFYFGERSLIRGAAAVTALNAEDELALRAAAVHRSIRILPYGLDFDEFASPHSPRGAIEAPKNRRTILLLGPLDPLCGCVSLLKAVAELGPDADGWNIELAGDDGQNQREKLKAAIQRKGAANRVVFSDAPTPADQRAALARAAMLVAPCLHVCPPVSIMQAVAVGVPVVASILCAPPGTDAAIRVCDTNRSSLREALRAVMRMEETERTDLAQAALATGRATLDWSVLAPRYADLYRELA